MMWTTGAIFIGGAGSRMGGCDKSRLELDGQPFWSILLENMRTCVDEIIFIGNKQPDWWSPTLKAGFLTDYKPKGHQIGPTGALVAGLEFLAARNRPSILLTAPVDTPFLSPDIVLTLRDQVSEDCPVAIAGDENRRQPMIGAWSVETFRSVRRHVDDGARAMNRLADHHKARTITFSDAQSFLNINTPEDLAFAKSLRHQHP